MDGIQRARAFRLNALCAGDRHGPLPTGHLVLLAHLAEVGTLAAGICPAGFEPMLAGF
jgi:hypothetical protein